MWYLHSHFTWDWVCHSCIWLSFQPHGAFTEGEPNFSCRRWVRCNGRAQTRPRPLAVDALRLCRFDENNVCTRIRGLFEPALSCETRHGPFRRCRKSGGNRSHRRHLRTHRIRAALRTEVLSHPRPPWGGFLIPPPMGVEPHSTFFGHWSLNSETTASGRGRVE